MTTRMVLDKMTTVPDPNKQTFPIIQNATQFFTVPNCPSPTKTVESVTLSMKQPSIQLPELIHGGGGDHKERSEQTTTTSFPKVGVKYAHYLRNFQPEIVEGVPYYSSTLNNT